MGSGGGGGLVGRPGKGSDLVAPVSGIGTDVTLCKPGGGSGLGPPGGRRRGSGEIESGDLDADGSAMGSLFVEMAANSAGKGWRGAEGKGPGFLSCLSLAA